MLSVPQLISDLQFKIRQLLLCFGFQGEDIIKWPQRHKTFYRQIVPSLQLMISDVGFFQHCDGTEAISIRLEIVVYL